MNDSKIVDYILGNELVMLGSLTIAMTWFLEAVNNDGLGEYSMMDILGEFGNDVLKLSQKYEVSGDIGNVDFTDRETENAYYGELDNLYTLYEKKLGKLFTELMLDKTSIELICEAYKLGVKNDN